MGYENMYKIVHLATVDISIRYLLLNQLIFLKNHEFLVNTISSDGNYVKEIRGAGINHISIRISRKLFSPIQDIVSLYKLVQTFRKHNFLIVHTHTPKASFLGQIAAKLAGSPIIIRTLHGFYFHEYTNPVLRKIMILMETIAGRCSDLILSQNKEDLETAIKEGICSIEKIKFLGNGIDIERFNPNKIKKTDLERKRRELGLDNSKKVIGFVGRLVAEKGVLELFQVAKIIQQERKDVLFLFVGHVDDEKKDAVTPKMAEEFGVADICRFIGFQEEMPLIYSMMDLFVLPSHREGFPRAAMEASAMGVPCIVTDIRGCREVVYDQKNGFLVPLGDVQALSQAMIDLLNNPSIAVEMGKTGRNIARERFDERIVFQKVIRAYQTQLGKKRLLQKQI